MGIHDGPYLYGSGFRSMIIWWHTCIKSVTGELLIRCNIRLVVVSPSEARPNCWWVITWWITLHTPCKYNDVCTLQYTRRWWGESGVFNLTSIIYDGEGRQFMCRAKKGWRGSSIERFAITIRSPLPLSSTDGVKRSLGPSASHFHYAKRDIISFVLRDRSKTGFTK